MALHNHSARSANDKNLSSLVNPAHTEPKVSLLQRIAQNRLSIATFCKWAGAISVIGGGAYGVSHIANLTPNGSGGLPAFGFSGELKNNTSSSKVTLNRNGLPWPENPTPATVQKDYSWEQEFKQPGSAKNLPYYGKVTPAEVVDHINLVWNAAKDVRHVPGQTTGQTWKRIQEKVDPVIKSLGYAPTIAHKQIMYDAGIATFITTNVTYGEADQTIPGLGRNEILSYYVNDEESGKRFANLLLKQRELRGVCADIAALDMSLKDEAGILAVKQGVYRRGSSLEAVANDSKLINHAVVVTMYPTKAGALVSDSERRANMLGKFCNVLSNPTSYPLSAALKGDVSNIKVFPNMSEFSAGAKGDDVFRVYFGALNTSFKSFSDGSDFTKVREFAPGGSFALGKPLDTSFNQLFSDTKQFEDNWIAAK